jgi:hypothetical protein
LKQCRKCKKYKDLNDFHKQAGSRMKDGHRNKCKECRGEERRERYANDPEHWKVIKSQNLKSWYGMTLDQWNQMFMDQKGCCAICEEHVSKLKTKELCVDHDHSTGEIRGLLCHSCNRGIGLLKDSPEILSKTLVYFNRSKIRIVQGNQ